MKPCRVAMVSLCFIFSLSSCITELLSGTVFKERSSFCGEASGRKRAAEGMDGEGGREGKGRRG